MRNIKECVPNAEGSHRLWKSNYTSLKKDKIAFKRVGKTVENFMPLNIRREQIWREVIHMNNNPTPP